MIHDVDVAVLIAKMRSALPATLSLTNVTISLNNTSEQSVGSAGSAASLDTSGHQHIGTVTLSGSGITLADLAGYVANLAALPGVADVIPSSNATTATVAIKHGKQAPSFTQFNIALTVTDELYSHHFDVTSKGGN
jgi:hypothetical protein